jgi:hypothetical protein
VDLETAYAIGRLAIAETARNLTAQSEKTERGGGVGWRGDSYALPWMAPDTFIESAERLLLRLLNKFEPGEALRRLGEQVLYVPVELTNELPIDMQASRESRACDEDGGAVPLDERWDYEGGEDAAE